MTAQFTDGLRHGGTEYRLIGIPDPDLFDPWMFGLDPVGTCTACHLGYVATFAVLEVQLVIDALDVNLYAPEADGRRTSFTPVVGPPVNGVAPRGRSAGLFNNRYRALAHPLDYTGDLLIGDGFIPEFYSHTRSAAAWTYRTVVELVFEDGRLRRETDRSAEAAEARARVLSDRMAARA